MEPKRQVLSMVRFAVAPRDLPATLTENVSYEPLPTPHVKYGTRRFPWHLVVEFQVPLDAAQDARKKK